MQLTAIFAVLATALTVAAAPQFSGRPSGVPSGIPSGTFLPPSGTHAPPSPPSGTHAPPPPPSGTGAPPAPPTGTFVPPAPPSGTRPTTNWCPNPKGLDLRGMGMQKVTINEWHPPKGEN
ncbi:hypothetical protein TWF970_001734 [Orbilia oligospora]|uniref:Uncharacterized protein n=1 Tax=Orbilia oligospora TaxID=2813651 RepID=A0A7C8RFG7_ORBOL|nr:hypothetical protein TWF970_001734 [Orbilia oligospora]